jgi:hypothetical protein
MSFLKRSKASPSSHLAETTEEIMQRRARGFITTVREQRPREFAQLLGELEQGDLARARLTLRELASIVDEGYIEPVLQQLQAQGADSRLSS